MQPIIHNRTLVKSYRYGDTLEITTAIGTHTPVTKVLPNHHYVDLRTGEVKPMNTTTTVRSGNLKSVKTTMRKLRRLVAHNFNGGNNQLWITLTYAEHITDTQIVYRDFKQFIKRVRKKHSGIQYIAVIEPQASGRWHLHVLLKSESIPSLVIPNDDIANWWKCGFTKTKRLKHSDKAANYLMAYLTDINLTELALDDTTEKTDKKISKGLRLHLYPKGVRIYRASKGINHPIEVTDQKETILKENGVLSPPDFSTIVTYPLADGEEVTYRSEYYNNLKTPSPVNHQSTTDEVVQPN